MNFSDGQDSVGHTVKGMVFPVVTYRCESWSIRKAENRRIDAFKRGAGEDS